MTKTRLSLALLLVSALIVLAAFAGRGGAAGTSAEATRCSGAIGVMAPITGPAASIGQEQLHWAELAIERYNRARGTKYTLIQGDTQLDAAQASTVGQKFVSTSNILAIVGPAGSQEVEAVGPLFRKARLAYISMSATRITLTSGKYPTFFRVVPHDGVQAPTDANYIADTLKAKRVFVVDDQTSYSVPLADGVQKVLQAKGVRVDRESVNQKQTDFSALVSKIASDTAVVVLPWQIAANAQLFGQQMREQGKRAVIFGTDGLFSPKDFNIEGSYVSAFAPDIHGQASAAALVKAYQARYGDFGTFGPPTYAAAWVALDGITKACKRGKVTRNGVLAQIRKTNQRRSILGGPIRFTAKGDVVGSRFYIFQIKDGKYVLVK